MQLSAVIVFALVAFATSAPTELGNWELTDSGWQWVPLGGAPMLNATSNATTAASTVALTNGSTIAPIEGVTSQSTFNATTIKEGEGLNTTVPSITTIGGSTMDLTFLPTINATAFTTTIASNSTDISGNHIEPSMLNATTLNTTTTLASTTVFTIGNELDGMTTKLPETLSTIVPTTTTTTFVSTSDMTSLPTVNASTTTIMPSTSTLKIGNDLDGVKTTLNETTLTTTHVPSTTTIKIGNDTVTTTKHVEILNTTTAATTTMASTAAIKFGSDLDDEKTMLNATAPTTTVALNSTKLLGHEMEGSTIAMNATTPITTTIASTTTIKFGNNVTTPAEKLNATVPTTTIKFGNSLDNVTTMPVEKLNATIMTTTPIALTSTIKFGHDLNGSTTVAFNATPITTTHMPTSTFKLGADMVNSTLAMHNMTAHNETARNATVHSSIDLNGTAHNALALIEKAHNSHNSTVRNIIIKHIGTVNIGHDLDGVANRTTLNATTVIPLNSTIKLGNDMNSSTTMFPAIPTTHASKPTIKFEGSMDDEVSMKKTGESTTAASIKELKPNTCVISEHASDHADCRRRADGDFFRNSKDCRMYYRCAHGLRMQCACPTGTVFSELTSVCDYEWAVPECNLDPQAWQPQVSTFETFEVPAM